MDQHPNKKKKNLRRRIIHTFSSLLAPKITYDIEKYFLSYTDILQLIIAHLYRDRMLTEACNDIVNFSLISSSIRQYFVKENYTVFKNTIKILAKQHNATDLYIAQFINKKIASKIEKLISISENNNKYFTKDDLSDPWFLNATFGRSSLKTILFITCTCFNVEKTKALIDAGIDCRAVYARHNALTYLTKKPSLRIRYSTLLYSDTEKENFFSILRLLFNAGINPDSRPSNSAATLLHRAAQFDKKELAYLLLSYGANPHLIYYDALNDQKHTAFTSEVGTPKGWLRNMYTDILFYGSKDLLNLVTHYVCTMKSSLSTIARTIKNFSVVNRQLHGYFYNTEIRKSIVRNIALCRCVSDLEVANKLAYPEITYKINNLFWVALNSLLSTNDLADKWYLDATAKKNYTRDRPLQTLICATTLTLHKENTQMLIKAGCDLTSDRCPNPLAVLVGSKLTANYKTLHPEIRANHFALLQLFLDAKIDPDSRYNISSLTYLHRAVNNGDKKRARLLLQHGADPYRLYFDSEYRCIHYCSIKECDTTQCKKIKQLLKNLPITTCYHEKDNCKEPWKYNAFHLEHGEPKGWLKNMYEEVQKQRRAIL